MPGNSGTEVGCSEEWASDPSSDSVRDFTLYVELEHAFGCRIASPRSPMRFAQLANNNVIPAIFALRSGVST